MVIIINDLGIPVWPIGILILVILLGVLWHRKHKLSYLFFFSIFWVYVMFGLDKVFFPLQINGQYVDAMKQISSMSQVNFVPFYFGQYGLTVGSVLGIVYNILLTVPLGFGLNFVTRVRTKDVLRLSIAIGLGIEIIQFVISLILGYNYRVVDINDALLNGIGIWLGYGLSEPLPGYIWL